MDEPRMPRRELYRQIAPYVESLPSGDQLDRWSDAGLLCEEPGSGRASRYGYTAAQRDRIIQIGLLQARLKTKRLRHSEIAFWLAFGGARDVPADLVCAHLEDSVRTFQSEGLRILNGLGSRNQGYRRGVAGIAHKLAGLLAKQIVMKVLPYFSRSSVTRDVLKLHSSSCYVHRVRNSRSVR